MYVELQNINKKFGAYQTTDNVSFSIEKGRLISLLDPSGSDKTTIPHIITELGMPDSGTIIINGQRVNDLPASDRGIGFVLQNYAPSRHMTVFDNTAFGLEMQRKDRGYINDRVEELIKLIGLKGLEHHRPHQLSSGQRQRVTFARTLALSPHLPLLDEPFIATDTRVRKELRNWLRGTINKMDITSIFVIHDQERAVEVVNEIIITSQSRIEQIRTPVNIYKNSTAPLAAGFIGESVETEGYGGLRSSENEKGCIKTVFRPEFVRITKISQEVYSCVPERGVVEDIFFYGNILELRLNVGGIWLVIYRSLEDDPFAVGEEVSVLIHRLYLHNDCQIHLVENVSLKSEQTFVI